MGLSQGNGVRRVPCRRKTPGPLARGTPSSCGDRAALGRSPQSSPTLPPPRLVFLSRAEVDAVLVELLGVHRLVAMVIYGNGLWPREGFRLRRVYDLSVKRGRLTVHEGEGGQDRVVDRR